MSKGSSKDPLISIAEKSNDLGVVLIEKKQFEEALKCFTDAIEFYPQNVGYYCNRVRCYIELWRYQEALDDAMHCMKLENGKVKSYEMQVKCHIAFGKLVEANACLTSMFTKFRGSEFVTSKTKRLRDLMNLNKEYLRYMEKENYQSALDTLNDLIEHMYRSIPHRLFKAHVFNKLNEYERAEKIANSVLALEPTNLTALKIIEHAQIGLKQSQLRDKIDAERRRLEERSRWRPPEEVGVHKDVDHRQRHCGQQSHSNNSKVAKKEKAEENSKVAEKVEKKKNLKQSKDGKCDSNELQVVYDGRASPPKILCSPKPTETETGNNAKLLLMEKTKEKATEAFNLYDYKKSYDLYLYALSIDPSNHTENAKLHFNKSVVALKLGNTQEAIDSCSKAIHLNPGYFKAYLRRAKLNLDAKHFKDAIMDYETVIRLKPEKGCNKIMEYKSSHMKCLFKICVTIRC